jgi:hypothetical protein
MTQFGRDRDGQEDQQQVEGFEEVFHGRVGSQLCAGQSIG